MSTCTPDIYGAPCTTDQNIPWWTPAPVDTDTLANTGFEPAQALAAFGIVFLVAGVLAVILEVRRRRQRTSARVDSIAKTARAVGEGRILVDPAVVQVEHLKPGLGIAVGQLAEWVQILHEQQVVVVFRTIVKPGAGYVIKRVGEPQFVVLNPEARPVIEAAIAEGRWPNVHIQEN